MENKSIRVDINKVDEVTKEKGYFGWQLVSQDDLKPDRTILLNFQRDYSQINDYATVRQLEKQYYSIKRPIPKASIVFLVVGLALLIGYFLLKSFPYFAFGILVSSLTSFAIAVFLFFIFLLIKIKSKQIIASILKEASYRTGFSSDIPNPQNTKKPSDYTGALSNTFSKK